jgi:hypothetical protein
LVKGGKLYRDNNAARTRYPALKGHLLDWQELKTYLS